MNINPYGISLILISICASVALASIWKKTKDIEIIKPDDKGLYWLSLGFGVWGLVGFLACFKNFVYTEHKDWYELVRSSLSTLNSTCLLFSIKSFEHAPPGLTKYLKEKTIKRTCVLILIITVVLFVISGHNETGFIWIPDITLSILTVLILGIAFYYSFKNRGYLGFSIISSIAMLLILLVQFPEFIPILQKIEYFKQSELLTMIASYCKIYEDWLTLISYSLVMMIAFALAASWGFEISIAINKLPLLKGVAVSFDDSSNECKVYFIIKNDEKVEIKFTKTQLENYFKFLVSKKFNINDGWVIGMASVDYDRVIEPILKAFDIPDNHVNQEQQDR